MPVTANYCSVDIKSVAVGVHCTSNSQNLVVSFEARNGIFYGKIMLSPIGYNAHYCFNVSLFHFLLYLLYVFLYILDTLLLLRIFVD